MGHSDGSPAGNRDEWVPGCDGHEGDGTDHQARSGAGADGDPKSAGPTDVTDPEDESDAELEPPVEAPSPGVPVSPEEYRRLKKQAAELPEDS